MNRGIRFSWNLRFWFYIIFGALFLSGVIWFGLYYLGIFSEDFNENFGWIKTWLMRVHGAAAMASLVLLGFLIPRHMKKGWAQKRNRVTAGVIVAWCLVLILSGYGLYYCSDEMLRLWLRNVHSFAGALIPIILIWHIFSGRAQT